MNNHEVALSDKCSRLVAALAARPARLRGDGDLYREDVRRLEEALAAEGEADAARILMEAHRQAPEFYAWLRSLEALRKMISDQTMLILDTSSPPLSVLKEPLGPPASTGTGVPTTQPKRAPAGGTPQ